MLKHAALFLIMLAVSVVSLTACNPAISNPATSTQGSAVKCGIHSVLVYSLDRQRHDICIPIADLPFYTNLRPAK